jgi:RND superfamily putative drug exporter
MKRREHRAGQAGRIWTAVLDRVVRRPVAALVLAGAVMLALAAPTLDLHLNDPGMGSLPQGEPAVVAFEDAQARFPGDSRPALVAVQASDVRAPEIQAAIERLEPTAVDVNRDGTVARLTVPLPGDGVDDRSFAALDRLRDKTLPATLGGIEGVRASVTGLTAYAADQKSVTESRAPLVFALVLGMGFLVLLVTFRSIVIPIKAIALNLLSVAASYGVLVLVFQKGWGESLLGFESTGAIAIWLPILLFVILFGLSMDYHVLVLSRIREAYEDGMSMDDAVAHGIKSTASVVTSAALVMVAVFSIFATLGILEMKQLGVGLAVAVLLDATIVRAVLLPASMKLLGEWNWYLPRGLRWLPRVGGEPRTIDPEPATA